MAESSHDTGATGARWAWRQIRPKNQDTGGNAAAIAAVIVSAFVGVLAAGASIYSAHRTTDAAHREALADQRGQVERLEQQVVQSDKAELRAVLDRAATRLATGTADGSACVHAWSTGQQTRLEHLRMQRRFQRLRRQFRRHLRSVDASNQRLLIRLPKNHRAAVSYFHAYRALSDAEFLMGNTERLGEIPDATSAYLRRAADKRVEFLQAARELAGTQLK